MTFVPMSDNRNLQGFLEPLKALQNISSANGFKSLKVPARRSRNRNPLQHEFSNPNKSWERSRFGVQGGDGLPQIRCPFGSPRQHGPMIRIHQSHT